MFRKLKVIHQTVTESEACLLESIVKKTLGLNILRPIGGEMRMMMKILMKMKRIQTNKIVEI